MELDALRRGLTREDAAASLWMLSGLEPYRLAERSGWSTDDYRDWYIRCARAVLLDP